MAKVTLTLEDTRDGESVVVSLDMSAVSANTFGSPHLTRAVRLSQVLYSQATSVENERVGYARLREVPVCSRQPPSTTVH